MLESIARINERERARFERGEKLYFSSVYSDLAKSFYADDVVFLSNGEILSKEAEDEILMKKAVIRGREKFDIELIEARIKELREEIDARARLVENFSKQTKILSVLHTHAANNVGEWMQRTGDSDRMVSIGNDALLKASRRFIFDYGESTDATVTEQDFTGICEDPGAVFRCLHEKGYIAAKGIIFLKFKGCNSEFRKDLVAYTPDQQEKIAEAVEGKARHADYRFSYFATGAIVMGFKSQLYKERKRAKFWTDVMADGEREKDGDGDGDEGAADFTVRIPHSKIMMPDAKRQLSPEEKRLVHILRSTAKAFLCEREYFIWERMIGFYEKTGKKWGMEDVAEALYYAGVKGKGEKVLERESIRQNFETAMEKIKEHMMDFIECEMTWGSFLKMIRSVDPKKLKNNRDFPGPALFDVEKGAVNIVPGIVLRGYDDYEGDAVVVSPDSWCPDSRNDNKFLLGLRVSFRNEIIGMNYLELTRTKKGFDVKQVTKVTLKTREARLRDRTPKNAGQERVARQKQREKSERQVIGNRSSVIDRKGSNDNRSPITDNQYLVFSDRQQALNSDTGLAFDEKHISDMRKKIQIFTNFLERKLGTGGDMYAKFKDTPVRILIDSSLLDKRFENEYLEEWTYLIMGLSKFKNVSFVFASNPLYTESGMDGALKKQFENSVDPAGFVAELKKRVQENVALYPGCEAASLGVRISDGSLNWQSAGRGQESLRSIDIPITSKDILNWMKDTDRLINANEFPVAMESGAPEGAEADASLAVFMNFDAALTVGLAKAILASIKTSGNRAEIKAARLEFAARFNALYKTMKQDEPFSAMIVKYMLYDDGDISEDGLTFPGDLSLKAMTIHRLSCAIDLAIPPAAYRSIEDIRRLHVSNSTALHFA
ncbi:MAG: hypothetical protein HQL28_04170 [Candidatus Omnitrophica bacterium]|nr:hypothetical protein [Candidatus Omnitrophota bacterium]